MSSVTGMSGVFANEFFVFVCRVFVCVFFVLVRFLPSPASPAATSTCVLPECLDLVAGGLRSEVQAESSRYKLLGASQSQPVLTH